MINRYGMIPSGAWRKDSALANEWGGVVKIVKKLSQIMALDPMQIAWYVRKYRVVTLDYKEFGLVRYKITKYFKWENLESFRQHYDSLYKSMIGESSAYVEQSTGYRVKEAAPAKRSLQDILGEIENDTERS